MDILDIMMAIEEAKKYTDGVALGQGAIQGPPGPRGLQGIQGSPGQDAIANINALGPWDSTTMYMQNDFVVATDGNSYIAIADNIMGAYPPNYPNLWAKFVASGADGPQGPQGEQGEAGPPGEVTTQQLNAALLGKLDKVTSTGSERVYAVSADGQTQKTINVIGNSVDDYTIPMRNADGTFSVGIPKNDGDAVNKKYVDDNIGGGAKQIKYINSIPGVVADGTSLQFLQSLADKGIAKGDRLFGDVEFTDLPFFGNAELTMDIFDSGVFAVAQLFSSNIEPYFWIAVVLYDNEPIEWQPVGGADTLIASNDRFLVKQSSELETATRTGPWSFQIGGASEIGRFFIDPSQFPDLVSVDDVSGIIGHYATTIGSKMVLFYQDNLSYDVLKVFEANEPGQFDFEDSVDANVLANITRCLLAGHQVWLARFSAANQPTGIAEGFLHNVGAPSTLTYSREVTDAGLRVKFDVHEEPNGSFTLTDKNGNPVRTIRTGVQFSDLQAALKSKANIMEYDVTANPAPPALPRTNGWRIGASGVVQGSHNYIRPFYKTKEAAIINDPNSEDLIAAWAILGKQMIFIHMLDPHNPVEVHITDADGNPLDENGSIVESNEYRPIPQGQTWWFGNYLEEWSSLIGGDPFPTDDTFFSILEIDIESIKAILGDTFQLRTTAKDITGAINELVTIHSADEQETSAKWIDGKPIYRRTFTGQTGAAGEVATIGNVGAIETLVSLRGAFAESAGITAPLPYYDAITQNACSVYLDADNNVVAALSPGWFMGANRQIHVTVEYTRLD